EVPDDTGRMMRRAPPYWPAIKACTRRRAGPSPSALRTIRPISLSNSFSFMSISMPIGGSVAKPKEAATTTAEGDARLGVHNPTNLIDYRILDATRSSRDSRDVEGFACWPEDDDDFVWKDERLTTPPPFDTLPAAFHLYS